MPSTEVRNLGVILDCKLSFHVHIKNTTKSAFFHLNNISRLLPSLSDSVTETLINAFITSRLAYCNEVLYGLPSKDLNRLQYCMFRTQLPGSCPIQNCGNTLSLYSNSLTSSQSSLASHSKFFSLPTNPSTHCLEV